MEILTIKGKVVYKHLGTGCWGIVDSNQKNWRPVNLPPNMQQEGLEVEVNAKKADEDVSFFMWGNPVEIIDIILPK